MKEFRSKKLIYGRFISIKNFEKIKIYRKNEAISFYHTKFSINKEVLFIIKRLFVKNKKLSVVNIEGVLIKKLTYREDI